MRINKWLILILVVFLLTLGILVYYTRIKTTTDKNPSTVSSNITFLSTNSYVFASPIRAKVGGDLIRVTVFILDDNGYGIENKKVSLKIDSEVTVKNVQELTDDIGKAFFDLGSEVKGTYTVEAFVDDVVLDQKVKVVFDNQSL